MTDRGGRTAAAIPSAGNMLAGLESALREADPAAFFAPPRIMRRVIKEDRGLSGPVFAVPHRKTYLIRSERLRDLVEPEELGLAPGEALPAWVILITKPNAERLAAIDEPTALGRYWRLLFHARVHAALEERIAAGLLGPEAVRDRVDRVGQAAFDEAHAVLRQEHYLFPSPTQTDIYVEFAAVYLELRHFAPHWLPTYFPSIEDHGRVDAVFAEDVDAAALLRATRLAGAPDPEFSFEVPHFEDEAEQSFRDAVAEQSRPQPRVARRLAARADRAWRRGNAVGSAILRLRAARRAAPEDADELSRGAVANLRDLVRRLQAALQFTDDDAVKWRAALIGLLRNSTRGFWDPDKRLLHDLQKVCVDHEREIYTVDLLEWARSLGRRPIKRPLPNQREVLVSKHLRRAISRLSTTRLPGSERRRLAELLHRAASAAEHHLRERLRPVIEGALDERGFTPDNVPEQVARRKLVEELLDGVVARGFLTIGHLRDAISQSDLKLPDLAGPRELLLGDPLLRTDRRLAEDLDGVYHGGEFYMRWLQRLSAMAFGTPPGRLFTRFVAIPFGGAYVILEGLHHLVHLFTEHPPHLSGWPFVLAGGFFLLLMIHARAFRGVVVESTQLAFRSLRGLGWDLPRWVANRAFVRNILGSRPVVLLRRAVLAPLVVTLLVWAAVVGLGGGRPGSPLLAAALFVALTLLLNSRLGRNMEEVTAEWTERTWYRIRVRVFVAIYEVIMDAFKRALEWSERVLYAVDEWLQFRSGQTRLTLAWKAVLGLVWGGVIYVSRFCINLLIEPQINPIKHFPVVTVAHKIILPLGLPGQPLSRLILPLAGTQQVANAWAASIVWLIPGVFGFIAWELKSNWRLYETNRHKTLRPAMIGSHGETLIRFLKPGFHSGTVPKLFAKLRRAERKSSLPRYRNARRKLAERLHHVEVELRHFFEREFVTLLRESRGWQGRPISVGHISIASNSLSVELTGLDGERPLRLMFQEQSGWLVAGVPEEGWAAGLPQAQRAVLLDALAGLYKRGGVDLVRGQIESCLEPQVCPYDVRENALVCWPGGGYDREVRYDLSRHTLIRPRPPALAATYHLPSVESSQLIFSEHDVRWSDWAEAWERDRAGGPIPPVSPARARLLSSPGAALPQRTA